MNEIKGCLVSDSPELSSYSGYASWGFLHGVTGRWVHFSAGTCSPFPPSQRGSSTVYSNCLHLSLSNLFLTHWQNLHFAPCIRNVQDMDEPSCPKCYFSVLFPQITSTALHWPVKWLVPCRDALRKNRTTAWVSDIPVVVGDRANSGINWAQFSSHWQGSTDCCTFPLGLLYQNIRQCFYWNSW